MAGTGGTTVGGPPIGSAGLGGLAPASGGGAQQQPGVGAGGTNGATGGNGGGNVGTATGGAGAPNMAGAGESGSGAPAGPDSDAADWRMMGYDLGSTYFNSAETMLSKQTAPQLGPAWTKDLGGAVYGAALLIGDKVYASGIGGVYALDVATGDQLWQVSLPASSSLSYVDGTLYINSQAGQVVALNAADGKQLWSKTPDPEGADGSSSVIPAGDLLLVGGSSGLAELTGGGTYRGYLAALQRATGEKAWTTFTVPASARGASIWSSPSVDLQAGLAFAGTGNNYGVPATDTSDSIIAFDLAGGNVMWKNQRIMNDTFGAGTGPDSDFGANPVLYETMVGGVMTKLVADGAKGGTVHSLRRDDGSVNWNRTLCSGAADGSSGIFTNFTWTGKNLLVACNGGGPATLYALDGATGDIVWMRALQGQVWGRTAVANGVGFVGTGSTLEMFDVDTGKVINSFPSKGGTIASTITIAHGRVAFGEGLSWSSGKAGTTLTMLAIQ